MNTDEIQAYKERNASLEDRLVVMQQELLQLKRTVEIEAALEKVRDRTIVMRNSRELSETSAVLFNELKELGIHAIRTGVGIFDDANAAMELWLTTVSDNQEVIQILDYFSLYIHPVFENIIPARQQNKPYALTQLEGNQVKEYYQSMSTYLSQPQNHQYHEKEFFYSFFFSQGTLNVVAKQSLTEEECSIMIRFARVFGLIYTRFQDLQKAEAQTRDAFRQNSLDRVRAETASMRTADDLERITPLIWRELVMLGVPFFRCGVFIVDETSKQVHSYLSTPEGTSLAVLHLPFDGADTTKRIVEHWQSKKVYKDHWDRQQFTEWVQSMVGQGQVNTIQQYQAGDKPPESLSLQFIPFTQGMLYVGSHDPLDDDQVGLVKSLADAFSVAYARYEDFKQLEEAKNRIQMTLSELEATQSLLIQSEKMASLGELTAGIAHEIQNPLNFVNNFSEVSTELIKEMMEEVQKGNTGEVKAIATDLVQNLEKINFHGKRADGIVKGMLQHSRSSSGQLELTDINVLCDEYLRLAYHGLRAKDKSFNAKFEAELDPYVDKVLVMQQEIGRVLLNLINNAFYAVTERKKHGAGDYTPFVKVTTAKHPGKVEIVVMDNGTGIPQKVIDKIFQPFFTTKPAGQGTGLGLSLSYDIIKSHGGELQVETKDGEYTAFIIVLPTKNISAG